MTILLAFTGKGFAGKILRGNDLSYGIYIYHMPVMNIFVHLMKDRSITSPLWILFLILVSVIGLAYISWVCVERKALALKTR
jgi:peptidoglycan/LPS O-acetylase OafA/YrhL